MKIPGAGSVAADQAQISVQYPPVIPCPFLFTGFQFVEQEISGLYFMAESPSAVSSRKYFAITSAV